MAILERIVFGAGMTGTRVAELACARGENVIAVVRSAESAARLANRGFAVTRDSAIDVARRAVTQATHAIVCFPPDGSTDATLAPLLARARAVSYVSTTGVYGDREGTIDDRTAVATGASSDAQRPRLDAEAAYRAIGGTILRAPGIYGPNRGLHLRVVRGLHAMPGDGSGMMSRIHVDDLSELLLASPAVHGETYVVGDLAPAPQREVVEWICAEYNCPMPPSVAPEAVHDTLRRNRRIDPGRVLRDLAVTLRYPTYRDGMKRTSTA
ncbi:SDR family oxidoreductase [soil metagenome]